jgi:hypothetical protein
MNHRRASADRPQPSVSLDPIISALPSASHQRHLLPSLGAAIHIISPLEEEKKANSNRQQTSAGTAARHDTSLRFVPNNDIEMTFHLRK